MGMARSTLSKQAVRKTISNLWCLRSLIPRERYNANIAVREIQNLLKDRTYAERAAAIGAQVRNEDGTARACDLLGRLLEAPNAEVTNPQLTAQVV